ncbi:sugar phosphate isomerase/epimerase [Aureimonas altamirensis]|uniref:sugar phosphate isomerase/epimerase family protein n=1 Tax=Aureimonas altamirensis TaxID=370622 RepID=UPI0020373733|nr:TIM barrel protein [Aureimonas altamirensis]MCM2505990.1 sugar phosphate isomerase/epimerase [Aureimonas altamirensis]
MTPRRSISNIAWPAKCDEDAIALVQRLGFEGVELAPSKVFGPLDAVVTADLRAYRCHLASRGLAIPALQAILFGISDAHLFAGPAMRKTLASHLGRVAEVAGELGAGACVFGSPGLRDPGMLGFEEAEAIAAEFFAELAPKFASHGTVLAFEANPPVYGCRFVTRTLEAIELVERVETAGFGLQLDTGTVFTNGEDMDVTEQAARLCVHCHLSEEGLGPVDPARRDYEPAFRALERGGYRGWVSIEMRAQSDWRRAIELAAQALLGETRK